MAAFEVLLTSVFPCFFVSFERTLRLLLNAEAWTRRIEHQAHANLFVSLFTIGSSYAVYSGKLSAVYSTSRPKLVHASRRRTMIYSFSVHPVCHLEQYLSNQILSKRSAVNGPATVDSRSDLLQSILIHKGLLPF